jgi:O-antigen/teichoic acid export membrane protein
MKIKSLQNRLDSHFRDSHFGEVMRGSFLVLAAKAGAIPISLLSSLVIARYYGADIMGIVALVNSFVGVMLAFALFGTNVSILKLVPEHREKYSLLSAAKTYKRILVVVFINCALLALVLVSTSEFIAEKIFSKPHLTLFIALAGALLFLRAGEQVTAQMLRALREIKLFSGMIIFSAVINLGILITITAFFYYKNNPVYLTLFFPAIPLVISGVFISRFLRDNAEGDDDTKPMSLWRIYVESQPMFFTNVMQLIIVYTDVLMLGAMRSEAEVGVYSVDVRLALLTAFILTSINAVLAPKLSTLFHAEKTRELIDLARKSTALIFWATVPILLVLVVLGYWILQLFGEVFTDGYSALVLLAIGRFIAAAAGPVGYFLSMTGRAKSMRNIVIFSGSLNIVLNYLLIPKFGINGAAAASMVSIAANNVVATIQIRRQFGATFFFFPYSRARLTQ